MAKSKLLIVEDDEGLAQLIADFFSRYEFDCGMELNAVQAPERILNEQPDLLILDLMMPDIDGVEICRQVRDKFRGKIIMLTARTDLMDQIAGLEMGADDYIPKPVEPRLLLAKARSVLRRDSHTTSTPENSDQNRFAFGDITINLRHRTVQKGEDLVNLSGPEVEILTLFLKNPGKVIDREFILQNLRGIEYDGRNRQVDITVSRLRSKLEHDTKNPKLIKTIRNRGYVFVGEME
ncbi:response regulator transcription factor [Pseudoteredinibacter isoporae]|uniref:response regulator transcription factor n=1 Tax=Pseudoteredinibacter isoporae TaxID=570281 RepID=UPI003101D625